MNTYTTILGDTWDLISLKVYGNTKYTDMLTAANQNEELLSTVIFSAGTIINVPEISTDQRQAGESLPPWRFNKQ